jgi:hypothetical protein
MEPRITGCQGVLPTLLCGFLLASLQPAHGQAGASDASYHPNPTYFVNSVTIQPDGKAIVGGGFYSIGGLAQPFVARLNSNGTLDIEFAPPVLDGPVTALLLQPNGQVLVGGPFAHADALLRGAVVRLEANGTLDTNLDSTLDGYDHLRAMALQTDGKFLVASDE